MSDNLIVNKMFRATHEAPDFPGVPGKSHIPKDLRARRNKRAGAVSALILKGVVSILDGRVQDVVVEHHDDGSRSVVTAHVGSGGRRTSAVRVDGDGNVLAVYAPAGLSYVATYHLTMTIVAEGLTRCAEAADLVEAWRDLLGSWDDCGRRSPRELAGEEPFRNAVLHACDEVYFWLRYGDRPSPTAVDDRVAGAEEAFVGDKPPASRTEERPDVLAALTDVEALDDLVDGRTEAPPEPAPARAHRPAATSPHTTFVGWQFGELKTALQAGEHALLGGPTGVGKTFCTREVLRVLERRHVTARGMEGLTDLDFIGAIVPKEEDRVWVDGPLTRALRLAQDEPVVFFLDELTRLPRVHLNVLPGLLDEQTRDDLVRQGVAPAEEYGDGPFYALELPMVSEVVWAPRVNFQVVAAGNFGRQYAVYDLDPAVRRRFDTLLEFDYLDEEQETALVVERAGLDETLARSLARAAAETRRLHANGELPGALDTGSLLAWARKAARRSVGSASELFFLAEITWVDQVCGRDHTGAVVEANVAALRDFLHSLLGGA